MSVQKISPNEIIVPMEKLTHAQLVEALQRAHARLDEKDEEIAELRDISGNNYRNGFQRQQRRLLQEDHYEDQQAPTDGQYRAALEKVVLQLRKAGLAEASLGNLPELVARLVGTLGEKWKLQPVPQERNSLFITAVAHSDSQFRLTIEDVDNILAAVREHFSECLEQATFGDTHMTIEVEPLDVALDEDTTVNFVFSSGSQVLQEVD
jgi:hypothetical protein